MKKFYLFILLILCAGLTFTACSDDDSQSTNNNNNNTEEPDNGGNQGGNQGGNTEDEYTPEVFISDIVVYKGVEAQIFDVTYPAENVAKIVVKWNDGAQSEEFTAEEDGSMTIRIDELTAGDYNYEFFSYDAAEHESLSYEVEGTVVSQEDYDAAVAEAGAAFIPEAKAAAEAAALEALDKGAYPAAILSNAADYNGETNAGIPYIMWGNTLTDEATMCFEYYNEQGELKYIEHPGSVVNGGFWSGLVDKSEILTIIPKDSEFVTDNEEERIYDEVTDYGASESVLRAHFYWWTEYRDVVSVEVDINESIQMDEDYAEQWRTATFTYSESYTTDYIASERKRENW